MKIKTRVKLIQISLLITLSGCLLLTYYLAKKSYQESIYHLIDSIISTHTKSLLYPLEQANIDFEKKTEYYKTIHRYTSATFKKNRDMPLEELKAHILKRYRLQDTDIELHVISKDYIIKKTSDPLLKGNKIDLSAIPSVVSEVDKALATEKVTLADTIKRAINLSYVKYALVKLDDDNVLEISFSNKTPINEIVNNIASYSLLKEDMFAVFENNNDKSDLFYHEMNKKPLTNGDEIEAYFNQKQHYIKLDQVSADPVIQAYYSNKPIIEHLDDRYVVYANIFQRDTIQTEYTNVITRFEVDISGTNVYLERLKTILIGVSIFLLVVWLAIYSVFRKHLIKPLSIVNEHVKNGTPINLKHFDKESEIESIALKYNTLIKKNMTLLSTDHLTKALNRKAFDNNTAEYINEFQQTGNHFCVLMMDLDNFKTINDTLGHDKGDEVLIKLKEIAQQSIDTTDEIYRLGGEEFAIIFKKTEIVQAIEMGNLINKNLNKAFNDLQDLSLSFSGGLSIVREKDDVDSIYKRCDTLMYKAKMAGKNRIETDEL